MRASADRSSSVLLMTLAALVIFLPLISAADEPAASAGTSPSSAMVESPCPPPLPMPAVMASGLNRMLNPGKLDGDLQSMYGRPDVQEYLKAIQERARTDWPNLCRYQVANAALTKSPRTVFTADSITELWAAADPELFRNGVVGRGISGQTSPRMLLRFFQDVVELHPRAVHIMAGTNDLAGNTGPSSVQDFKDNIMAMVELAHAHQIKVMLASIPPARIFPWKQELRPATDIVVLNRWLRSYATANRSEYIDYYSVLVDDQAGFLAALSNDGVHPNRDGYVRMRALAAKAIAQ
jgi:lysophospholipase L1-like esterase